MAGAWLTTAFSALTTRDTLATMVAPAIAAVQRAADGGPAGSWRATSAVWLTSCAGISLRGGAHEG